MLDGNWALYHFDFVPLCMADLVVAGFNNSLIRHD